MCADAGGLKKKPVKDLRLISPVLNSPTIQFFFYIYLYI